MVQLLFASALLGHRDCPARLAGVEVTHWCVVPSLKGRAGPHPVESAVWPFLSQSLSKITLQVQTTQEPRRVRVDRFASDVELGAGAHVLVLDDTWTAGDTRNRRRCQFGRVVLASSQFWYWPDGWIRIGRRPSI